MSFLLHYFHSFRIFVIPSGFCHSFHISVIPSGLLPFLPSELLSFQIFVILNSSCTLPYPKGEKSGRRSRHICECSLKFGNNFGKFDETIYVHMTSLLELFVINTQILTHFFNDRKKLLIFALRLGIKCSWSSSWSCASGYSSSWSSAPSCSTRGGNRNRRGCTYTGTNTCTSLKEKKIEKN